MDWTLLVTISKTLSFSIDACVTELLVSWLTPLTITGLSTIIIEGILKQFSCATVVQQAKWKIVSLMR